MKYRWCSLHGFFESWNKKSTQRQSSDCCQTSALPEGICREFSLAEIKAATNNFDPGLIIGQGSFGSVYRGTVDDGAIAVKLLNVRSREGVEQFKTEAQLLCQLRHPNLLSFIGFCHEQNKMILVYEYMSRGSLGNFINGYGRDCLPLPWNHRLQICIGAARGLHYLHTGVKRAVIHSHVKSLNILLDDDWSCKLSDFGLSKIGPLSMSKASIKRIESRIRGTIGYIAPEYYFHGILTDKSDVYSFGVILFEVLCSRKVDNLTSLRYMDVFEWTRDLARKGIMYDVIDPYLKGRIAPECFKKYWEIAYSCVHKEDKERPTMGEVEVTLELALELQKKADSEMVGITPLGEYMYEEASLSTDFDMHSDHYGDSCRWEPDGNSNWSEPDDNCSRGYLSDSDIEAR